MPQSTQTTRASKLGLHVALDKRAPHLSWCQWVTPLCLLEDIKSSLGILFGEFICRSYSIDETQMCILKVKLNLSSVVSPSVSYFLCVCVKKSQHVWYFHTSQVWSYTNIGSLVTDSRSANKRLHRTKAGCGGRIDHNRPNTSTTTIAQVTMANKTLSILQMSFTDTVFSAFDCCKHKYTHLHKHINLHHYSIKPDDRWEIILFCRF